LSQTGEGKFETGLLLNSLGQGKTGTVEGKLRKCMIRRWNVGWRRQHQRCITRARSGGGAISERQTNNKVEKERGGMEEEEGKTEVTPWERTDNPASTAFSVLPGRLRRTGGGEKAKRKGQLGENRVEQECHLLRPVGLTLRRRREK